MSIESDTQKTIEENILLARDLIRSGDIPKASDLLTTHCLEDSSGYANLQLANAKLYFGQHKDCIDLTNSLVIHAKNQRDAVLTIAALVTKGEAIIDIATFNNASTTETSDANNSDANNSEFEIQSAIESFGQALGISELFTESEDDTLTVLPLAGLAHSHWLWGNPKKARDLAERALIRASALPSSTRELLEARALLSKAVIQQTSEAFQTAIKQTELAKHISLTKRAQRFFDYYQSE